MDAKEGCQLAMFLLLIPICPTISIVSICQRFIPSLSQAAFCWLLSFHLFIFSSIGPTVVAAVVVSQKLVCTDGKKMRLQPQSAARKD